MPATTVTSFTAPQPVRDGDHADAAPTQYSQRLVGTVGSGQPSTPPFHDSGQRCHSTYTGLRRTAQPHNNRLRNDDPYLRRSYAPTTRRRVTSPTSSAPRRRKATRPSPITGSPANQVATSPTPAARCLYQPGQQRRLSTIPVGQRPVSGASPGRSKVYVANYASNNVMHHRTATNTVAATVTVAPARGLPVSPTARSST